MKLLSLKKALHITLFHLVSMCIVIFLPRGSQALLCCEPCCCCHGIRKNSDVSLIPRRGLAINSDLRVAMTTTSLQRISIVYVRLGSPEQFGNEAGSRAQQHKQKLPGGKFGLALPPRTRVYATDSSHQLFPHIFFLLP